jgi:hypothetical protein
MNYNIIHDKIKCTSHLSFGKIDSMVILIFYYIGRIMRIPQDFLRGVDRYYKQIKIDGGRI